MNAIADNSPVARRGWRPGKRWFWALLIASLGLNAFFIGATVTEYARFHLGKGERGPRIVRAELRWLADRLPPEAVKQVEGQLQPLKDAMAERLAKLRTLRSELDQLVAAPNPDRAAIDAHLREIRLEVGAIQEQVQSKTFEAVLALPADQRAALAKPSKRDDR